jgi:pilus assembly protein Flp/PilA
MWWENLPIRILERNTRRNEMKSVIAFLKDENGQTSTEYILLVAVVALIVMKFKNIAVTKLTEISNGVFGAGNDLANNIAQEVNSN